MHNPSFACRFERLGPGGRKCTCCNEFHGRHKKKLTRLVRRRLGEYFKKEIQKDLSPE